MRLPTSGRLTWKARQKRVCDNWLRRCQLSTRIKALPNEAMEWRGSKRRAVRPGTHKGPPRPPSRLYEVVTS